MGWRFIYFVTHERNQQIRDQQIIINADKEFFNKTEYIVKDPLDDLTRINVQNKFDDQLNKQRRIEHIIQRVKDAESEAYNHKFIKDTNEKCETKFYGNNLITNCNINSKTKPYFYLNKIHAKRKVRYIRIRLSI